mmetsp:Transcript_27214/g.26881  ORF Transcript_27214/g.26881 Transcript_27214/m.26881 type:complete len:207 (+) Transcript_27214:401-1021(+)
MDLRPPFIQQLAALENRLLKQGNGPVSSSWDEEIFHDPEEHVLRNTFLNAQMGPFVHYDDALEEIEKLNKLNWADNHTDEKEKLVDIPHPSSKNPVEDGHAILRSCMKGAEQIEYRAPLLVMKNEKPQRIRAGGEIIGNCFNKKEINGISHEDLQKLTESLHQDMWKSLNIKVPEKKGDRDNSPAGASKRRVSPVNVNVNRKRPNA